MPNFHQRITVKDKMETSLNSHPFHPNEKKTVKKLIMPDGASASNEAYKTACDN